MSRQKWDKDKRDADAEQCAFKQQHAAPQPPPDGAGLAEFEAWWSELSLWQAARSRPAPPAAGPHCPRCGGNVVCENTDCGWDAAKDTAPPAPAAEQGEPVALQELRDTIAANALNRRDYEGDFGGSYEFDVVWKAYHAVWGGLVTATKMLQDLHGQTPLCWVRPADVEFLSYGEPDVSDPADVELSPMEDEPEGQTMPLYTRPQPPPPQAEKDTQAERDAAKWRELLAQEADGSTMCMTVRKIVEAAMQQKERTE